MNRALAVWNVAVEMAAVIAIVILALGVMVRMIEPRRAFGRIGAVLGCSILLHLLPPIVLSLWRSLSTWQQLGIIFLAGAIASAMLSHRSAGRKKPKHRD